MQRKLLMAYPSNMCFRRVILLNGIPVLSLFFFVNTARAELLYQQKDKSSTPIVSTPIIEPITIITPDIDTLTPTYTTTPISKEIINDTATPTATPSPSPSATSTINTEITQTPTETSTSTANPEISPFTFAPIIAGHWLIEPIDIEIEHYLICDSLLEPRIIPDNYPQGVEDIISLNKLGIIIDLDVYLNVDHSWIGDLIIDLALEGTINNSVLLDRPGIPDGDSGCGQNNLRTILDDQASLPAETKCLGYPAGIAGIYKPSTPLSNFYGTLASGNWHLNISDNNETDTGQLNHWCLYFKLSNRIIPPTPTPPPYELPDSARIYGIYGEDQALPLDCESRSAVDWARYFGRSINEFEFFNQLPESDNPDVGFVGDVNGIWGQIPPDDYGVHAEPVASLLREYGLNAYARKALTWDDVRSEVSQSRPVITWVIGSVINGAPTYYTSQSDQQTTVVAKYEHTVIVIGYTPSSVIILDGNEIYERSLNRFLESWSALNNMAVLAHNPEE